MRKFAFVMCLVAAFAASGPAQTKTLKSEEVARSFYVGRGERLWFVDDHTAAAPDKAPYMRDNLLDNADIIDEILQRYSSIKEVKAIRRQFGLRIVVGVYIPSNPYFLWVPKDVPHNPDYLKVLFFPPTAFDPKLLGSCVIAEYDRQRNAILLPGLLMDEAWQDAILIHEMHHARYDAKGRHRKDVTAQAKE